MINGASPGWQARLIAATAAMLASALTMTVYWMRAPDRDRCDVIAFGG